MPRKAGTKNKKKAEKAPDLKVVPNQPEYQEPEAFVTETASTLCACAHEKSRHKENGCQHACKCLKTHA